jgi:hypothetical protein
VYDNLRFQYCDIFSDKLYCGTDPIKDICKPCDYDTTKSLCNYFCCVQRKIHSVGKKSCKFILDMHAIALFNHNYIFLLVVCWLTEDVNT